MMIELADGKKKAPSVPTHKLEANALNIMLWAESVLSEIDEGLPYFPMYISSFLVSLFLWSLWSLSGLFFFPFLFFVLTFK